MLKQLSLAAAALTFSTAALAQDKTARIDSIFSFATAETPGCAVGVSQNGALVANRAYGLGDVDRRVQLTPSSIFDIGSAQKQFVAAAILLLVEDGRLSLSEDIRKYVPELPDYGHKITLDHLLTHTSGIRDWTALLPLASGDPDALTMILRQRALNFTPGTEWAYSNSGYVLLKEIVARASGMSFSEFARRRLFEPLGMKSSAYVPDILQAAGDRALGYQKEGSGWKPYMRLGNNRGGGAVASTTGDLLRWNDALTSGRLGAFVTGKLQERARLNNGRQVRYARGLIVEPSRGIPMVSHSGGAAGYSTWLGRFPEHGLSVAVMCNFDPVSATALAGRVTELFLPAATASGAPPSPPVAAAGVSGVDVSAKAGLFFNERSGEPLRLVVSDGRLRVANGPPLVTVGPDRFRNPRGDMFFRSQDEFELTFIGPDLMELKSMEGQVSVYRRAQPWSPTAADLNGIDGRYTNDEIGTVFEIVPGKDAVTMRSEGEPTQSVELTAVDRDTYMRSMMLVRFRRDGSGKVVGFDYSNPLIRSLSFTRAGDRAATAQPAVPAPARPAAAPPPPAAPAMRLEGLTGEYELAPGRTLSITLENGRLYGQPSGGASRALTHVSGTTFSADGSGITLMFRVGGDGRATAVVMRQDGRERNLPKLR